MKISTVKLIPLMLALGCAHVSSAQAPTPGIQAARYRLVSQGEPAPYTGVLIDVPTYRAESAKFDAQAEAIKVRDATIGNMARDTMKYAARLRESARLLAGQRELTASAQGALATTQTSLVVTQKAAETLRPRWYEKPLTIGGVSFGLGVLATAYAISKF